MSKPNGPSTRVDDAVTISRTTAEAALVAAEVRLQRYVEANASWGARRTMADAVAELRTALGRTGTAKDVD